MGQLKKQMMDNDADPDNGLVEFLSRLSAREEFDGALSGITRQVIAQGPKSMTDSQRRVVEKFVGHYKDRNQCEKCQGGNISTLTDYIEVADNEYGLCPMCEYDRIKIMRD